MTEFTLARLADDATCLAPDGSEVRVLLSLRGGGLAHFRLPAGRTSRAVVHRTVDEIWYVVAGRGEIWRKLGDRSETNTLEPGVCLTLPVGTHFQFRSVGDTALEILGATMPPWPGDDEAVSADGPWPPNV